MRGTTEMMSAEAALQRAISEAEQSVGDDKFVALRLMLPLAKFVVQQHLQNQTEEKPAETGKVHQNKEKAPFSISWAMSTSSDTMNETATPKPAQTPRCNRSLFSDNYHNVSSKTIPLVNNIPVEAPTQPLIEASSSCTPREEHGSFMKLKDGLSKELKNKLTRKIINDRSRSTAVNDSHIKVFWGRRTGDSYVPPFTAPLKRCSDATLRATLVLDRHLPVIHPHSRIRRLASLAHLVLTTYVASLLPVLLAFETTFRRHASVLLSVHLVIDGAFLIFLLIDAHTGKYKRGVYLGTMREAWSHYAQKHFSSALVAALPYTAISLLLPKGSLSRRLVQVWIGGNTCVVCMGGMRRLWTAVGVGMVGTVGVGRV